MIEWSNLLNTYCTQVWHERSPDSIILTQSHYVDKILDKFNKDDSGIARTPVDASQHLSKNRGESIYYTSLHINII